MKSEELERSLLNFTGTDGYTQYHMLRLTDGTRFVAENAANGAFWLMDAICSYQRQCQKDAMLRDFQLWTLKVDLEKHTAVLTCERDTDDVAIRQELEYTDFPLSEIKFYVENGVLMLPSER